MFLPCRWKGYTDADADGGRWNGYTVYVLKKKLFWSTMYLFPILSSYSYLLHINITIIFHIGLHVYKHTHTYVPILLMLFQN